MACPHCTPTEPTARKSGYVGCTADGDRVWLEIELRHQDQTRETVDHETVQGYLELSITADSISKGQRRVDSCGQIVDTVRAINGPAKGWTAAELSELTKLWDRWHLNGMRAGCAHQDKGLTADDGLASPPCPVNGYRWGHAWLVEPLPADVEARVRELAAKLDGGSP